MATAIKKPGKSGPTPTISGPRAGALQVYAGTFAASTPGGRPQARRREHRPWSLLLMIGAVLSGVLLSLTLVVIETSRSRRAEAQNARRALEILESARQSALQTWREGNRAETLVIGLAMTDLAARMERVTTRSKTLPPMLRTSVGQDTAQLGAQWNAWRSRAEEMQSASEQLQASILAALRPQDLRALEASAQQLIAEQQQAYRQAGTLQAAIATLEQRIDKLLLQTAQSTPSTPVASTPNTTAETTMTAEGHQPPLVPVIGYSPQAARDRRDVVRNHDFGNGLTGWLSNGDGTQLFVVPSPGLEGSAACRVEKRTRSWNGLRQYFTSSLAHSGPGLYRLCTRVRLTAAEDDVIVRIGLRTGGQWTNTEFRCAATATDWTELEAQIDLRWDGELENASIDLRTERSLEPFYVDRCSLWPTAASQKPNGESTH